MKGLQTVEIIRKKANLEIVYEFSKDNYITSPRIFRTVDPNESMRSEEKENKSLSSGEEQFDLICCSATGEIYSINQNKKKTVLPFLPSQPFATDYTRESNQEASYFVVTDIASAQVFVYEGDVSFENLHKEKEINTLESISAYKGEPFIGPSSCIYQLMNTFIFCDSGTLGTTNLSNPTGSVFLLDAKTKQVTPILHRCLAHPAAVTLDSKMYVLYVTETLRNRVLKISQININNERTYYITTVFHQFAGRLGPTAAVFDSNSGYLFVVRFEYQNEEQTEDGIISVLNREGELLSEIVVEKKPEITGIELYNKYLYITERTSNKIYKFDLFYLYEEIGKYEEERKIN